jgi:hypothetical protein
MNKTAVALAFIVCVVVAAIAVVYIVRSQQPAGGEVQGDEFSGIDDQLRELEDFLNFENQTFDYHLGEISGDWG